MCAEEHSQPGQAIGLSIAQDIVREMMREESGVRS